MTITDATSYGRRGAALLAAHSEHLPRVLDVTVLGERRELELEAVTGPTLAALLAQRRWLPPAEAVTVVIGVARGVAALHAAGFSGVDLDEALVRFDAAGTPMVLGLDSLSEIVVAGAHGPADDWRALAALADRLGLVAHGRAAGALGPAQVGLGLALATLTAAESEQNIDRLEAALFELAEPAAVQLEGAEISPERPASPIRERRRGAAHRRPSSSVLIEAFDAGPAALLAAPLTEARSRAVSVLGRLHGRARLLLISGAAAVALTVAAVVLMPSGAGSQPPAPQVTSVMRSSSPSAAASSTPAASTGSVVLGSDPVAAAAELLARRDECLELTVEAQKACLARVADGQTSDLSEPARPLAGLTPSLIERTGDSALVALAPHDAQTAPASALLMRTEAGWRLRQLYEN